MYSFGDIQNKYSFEFGQTSELFREEVELYLSEHNIPIPNFAMDCKTNTVELCVETNEVISFYFTYNKNSGEYGVVKATKDEFEALSDADKI